MARKTRYSLAASAYRAQLDQTTENYYFSGDKDLRQRDRSNPDQRYVQENLFDEGSSSLLAVFGSSRDRAPEDNLSDLDAVAEELQEDRRSSIDSGINDLAEAVIKITGPAILSDAVELPLPYFGGAVMKDGTLAAVTLGEAAVYLYRDKILYALTQNDFNFESKSKPDVDDEPLIYAAGVAGMIRYSKNIKLKKDDTILLANLPLLRNISRDDLIEILESDTAVAVKSKRIFERFEEIHEGEDSLFLICAYIDEVKGGFWIR